MSEEENAARSASARGRRYILAAALLWSVSGVVVKSISLEPNAIAIYRSLFAGLLLLPFVPKERRTPRPGMIPGVLCFAAMIGLYINAVKLTTAANAIFLQCTATIWMIPLSAIFLKERPDPRAVVGIVLASFGVISIVLWGYDGREGEGLGVALALISGVAYAGVAVSLRGARGAHPAWLSAVNNLGGALILAAWTAIAVGPIALPKSHLRWNLPGIGDFPAPDGLIVLILFGAFQMAIPYALFARGLRDVKAPEAGLIALLEPVLNPVWVAIFIGEQPTRPTILGGLFLLAGVACLLLPSRPGERPAAES